MHLEGPQSIPLSYISPGPLVALCQINNLAASGPARPSEALPDLRPHPEKTRFPMSFLTLHLSGGYLLHEEDAFSGSWNPCSCIPEHRPGTKGCTASAQRRRTQESSP